MVALVAWADHPDEPESGHGSAQPPLALPSASEMPLTGKKTKKDKKHPNHFNGNIIRAIRVYVQGYFIIVLAENEYLSYMTNDAF